MKVCIVPTKIIFIYTSPWEIGVIVALAIFSSTQPKVPVLSCFAVRNVPELKKKTIWERKTKTMEASIILPFSSKHTTKCTQHNPLPCSCVFGTFFCLTFPECKGWGLQVCPSQCNDVFTLLLTSKIRKQKSTWMPAEHLPIDQSQLFCYYL